MRRLCTLIPFDLLIFPLLFIARTRSVDGVVNEPTAVVLVETTAPSLYRRELPFCTWTFQLCAYTSFPRYDKYPLDVL